MTNADKYFRNASDEDIAKFITKGFCRGAMDGKMPCKNDQYGISCKECWVDWLKQEVPDA
jgi:hypothetical protein